MRRGSPVVRRETSPSTFSVNTFRVPCSGCIKHKYLVYHSRTIPDGQNKTGTSSHVCTD